jgi:hypothetical protein
MRFRLVARDLLNTSLVEAAMDDFEVWDRGQGCLGCPQPAPTVGTIRVDRVGADVVLDWSADPIQASRFVVYQVFGAGFGESVRIGSTSSRSFVHQGAILAQPDAYYRVAAVDACGVESSKN